MLRAWQPKGDLFIGEFHYQTSSLSWISKGFSNCYGCNFCARGCSMLCDSATLTQALQMTSFFACAWKRKESDCDFWWNLSSIISLWSVKSPILWVCVGFDHDNAGNRLTPHCLIENTQLQIKVKPIACEGASITLWWWAFKLTQVVLNFLQIRLSYTQYIQECSPIHGLRFQAGQMFAMSLKVLKYLDSEVSNSILCRALCLKATSLLFS